MRVSEYLAGMTDATQQALVNDLTLGAGRLAFALRLHHREARTLAILAMLAGGYATLAAALTTLGGQLNHVAWTEPQSWRD